MATPRVDAELLLAGALGTSAVGRGCCGPLPPEAAVRRYDGYVARRAAREPLQHILGEAPFRHVVLAVGPGVFVPRPETELLVDAVLPHLRVGPSPLVVDLCAGLGRARRGDRRRGARRAGSSRSSTRRRRCRG